MQITETTTGMLLPPLDHADTFNDPLTPLVMLERSIRVFPTKEAVTHLGPEGERRLDWREFGELVGRFAAALQRDGIARGDRVAVLLPNVPEHLAATFAVPLVGGVLVAINTRLTAGEIGYILQHSGATTLLVDPELAGQVPADRSPDLRISGDVHAVRGTDSDA